MPTFSIQTVHFSDPQYPSMLKALADPPPSLYYAGDISVLENLCVSIIGSRSMSRYGEQVVRHLVPGMAESGLVVVSGLAYGVDSFAQTLAIKAGGKVAAVLGSGLQQIYPAAHTYLAEDIVEHGGVVMSELSPDTGPQKRFFPLRNRIVAALSKVTVIIEAALRSGTSITARQALEVGREVAVVPGDIFSPQSEGVHLLLKQGAHPVTSVRDILDLCGIILPDTPMRKPVLTEEQTTLYDLISSGGTQLAELRDRTHLSLSHLQSTLSLLELEGLIYCKGSQWHRIL